MMEAFREDIGTVVRHEIQALLSTQKLQTDVSNSNSNSGNITSNTEEVIQALTTQLDLERRAKEAAEKRLQNSQNLEGQLKILEKENEILKKNLEQDEEKSKQMVLLKDEVETMKRVEQENGILREKLDEMLKAIEIVKTEFSSLSRRLEEKESENEYLKIEVYVMNCVLQRFHFL
jgi:chromosome segregation ATPase